MSGSRNRSGSIVFLATTSGMARFIVAALAISRKEWNIDHSAVAVVILQKSDQGVFGTQADRLNRQLLRANDRGLGMAVCQLAPVH